MSDVTQSTLHLSEKSSVRTSRTIWRRPLANRVMLFAPNICVTTPDVRWCQSSMFVYAETANIPGSLIHFGGQI